MAFYFTLDDEGRLSWTTEEGREPVLTDAQGAVVASADAAWQLRNISASLDLIAEEIRDAGRRLAKDE